ncbi:hypothetical protein [Chitinophaga sancti]|uniref:hypothetical protein n=1 Tax=Chitinophaga sancti TaxID=1004 RepID=UPI003F78E29E
MPNIYTKLLAISGGVLMTIFSSCSKEDQKQVKEVAINMPVALSLNYGEEKDLDLPADLLSQQDVNFTLAFTGNENIQINANSRLYDQLAKAITLDRQVGKLHVNSGLIYPNGAVSGTTGKKLPDNYQVTLIANNQDETLKGKQTITVTVTPAKAGIRGLDNSGDLSYAYVLYSDPEAGFELEANGLSLEGTSWYLDSTGIAGVVALSGNKIQFKKGAGNPDKKTEKVYELLTTLRKDGFDVASRKFRVTFIPQIRFFYGTYYPEYDLTVVTNQVYIALGNAYVAAAPTLYPEKYKSAFSLIALEKDGIAFEDKDGLFSLNEKTGAITVKKNTSLTAGSYQLRVKALTTTGLTFTTTMTLNMAKLEE